MGIRPIQFAENEYYHLYNRGVEKRAIYLDDADYKRFIELLYAANTATPVHLRDIKRAHKSIYQWDRGEPLVAIGAYCLMPNHFHILVTPLVDKGVSIFMNKLGTSYSMYFNRKYKRTGSLFEGKFKAKWADTDEYLKYLFAYIHLNPVKLKQPDWRQKEITDFDNIYKHLNEFSYSSLPDYQSQTRLEACILNKKQFPEYFHSVNQRKDELLEWLTFTEY